MIRIAADLVLILLEPFSVRDAKWSHDTQSSTYNVTQGDGEQVVHQKLPYRNLGTSEHTQGNDEHVGHRVIKAQGYKGRNGEPDGCHFANHGRTSRGHVHGHTNEPITHDTPRKGSHPRKIGLASGNIDGPRQSAERSTDEHEIGHDERTDKVPQVARDPVLDEILPTGLALHVCTRDQSRVTRK